MLTGVTVLNVCLYDSYDASFSSTSVNLEAVFPAEEMLTPSSWMDDEYFEEHKLGINTHGLLYAAVHALSKQSTPTITLMGSGGWNTLFCIELQDGDKILARIPKIGGRSTDKIHSIVAMMTMARYPGTKRALSLLSLSMKTHSIPTTLTLRIRWMIHNVSNTQPWHKPIIVRQKTMNPLIRKTKAEKHALKSRFVNIPRHPLRPFQTRLTKLNLIENDESEIPFCEGNTPDSWQNTSRDTGRRGFSLSELNR